MFIVLCINPVQGSSLLFLADHIEQRVWFMGQSCSMPCCKAASDQTAAARAIDRCFAAVFVQVVSSS
jgi:hypothetical protein